MADYNHIMLVGRPTAAPETKTVGEDRKLTTFTLAGNRPYKDKDGKSVSDFFHIASWGKLAEVIGEYVKKGEDVLVDGRIQSRSYEQNNETKWITEIVAENVTFLRHKNAQKKEEAVALAA